MGQKHSQHSQHQGRGDDDEDSEGSVGSSRPKLATARSSRRGRLRRAFRSTGSNNALRQLIKDEQFSGIVKITLFSAEMGFADKWFACVSLGHQTFRTVTSSQTNKPVWKSKKNIVLEVEGPRIVYISVFETNRVKKNNLVGYCELDLSQIFNGDVERSQEVLDLFDPNSKTEVVGKITVGYSAETRDETEKGFALRLLSLVDEDQNGELSLDEFRALVKAFGNKVSEKKLESIFAEVDQNKDGRVSADELADLIAQDQDRAVLLKQCPVCGEALGNVDELNDMIHMSLCFDEGTGSQIMTGGFLTEKQASNGWMFKLSEWVSFSNSYDAGGLKSGASAAHILVFDRRTKRLVEELIDRKIVLSLRAIYQSKLTIALLDMRTKSLLLNMSKKQGERMATTQSAADIQRFIEFFPDRIKIDEFKYPVAHYKTFNDFFVRELKPGCRPIAYEDNDEVAICGADCRMMAYNSCDDAKRFWIKGRKFSIKGLIGSTEIAKDFTDGTLVIFRLAPQDYHRFHVPVSGVIGPIINIPGHLYTVNPIAVNSKYCNVFTENKRAVTVISTKEFGKVAFIAIGATMVGSITFTKKENDVVKKGDEFGYFSFGGSTCICVFQAKSIELDEDLLANSEKSLETLVYVGDSLGVSKRYSDQANRVLNRPTVKDSVLGLDNEVAKKGIEVSNSFNVHNGHLGWEGEPDCPDPDLDMQ